MRAHTIRRLLIFMKMQYKRNTNKIIISEKEGPYKPRIYELHEQE